MPDLTFKTSITGYDGDELTIRGHKLTDLISGKSFSEAIFLILSGNEPSKAQTSMIDAILVSGIDHGPGPASGFVPRVVASTGNSVNAALAAGTLTIGDYHGGAIEDAMKNFLQLGTLSVKDLVEQTLSKGERLAGYGHRQHKDEDPRTTSLENKASGLSLDTPHLTFAREIETELETQKGKKLPLNVDGAIAALLIDLGFTDPKIGKGIFAISRTPGMLAHILEELELGDPVRRIPEDQIEHTSM